MQVRWTALILLLLAPAAGCLGQGEDDTSGEDGAGVPAETPPGEDNGEGPAAEANANASRGTPAPILEPGTSFTFTTTGIYDGEDEVTVVVAEADEDGYLIAGAGPEDLPSEIAWGRLWMGQLDEELNRVVTDGMTLTTLFDFPLYDGKTWTSGERTMTVREQTIETPDGPEDGFAMTDDGDGWSYAWTYSPRLGYITSYTIAGNDVVYEHAVLQRVGSSNAWTWYERSARFHSGGGPDGVPTNAKTFELPEGTDALVVSAGGTPGNHLALTPPPGSTEGPWTYESADGEAWETAILPPTSGPWTVTAAWPEDGYVWGEMVAVRWAGNA